MSTRVKGFKPPDDKWKKMKAIWDACEEAGVDTPKRVYKFFDGVPPDESGVEVELMETPCCREYREEMRDGYEIEVAKLPKDIKIIRFWNSY